MPRSILLAVAAGLASGLLYMALLTGSMGGMLFAYLSQVPLFVAGLGLGLTPALAATGVAAMVVGLGGNLLSAVLFIATSAVPVLLLVRQALLNRPNPDGTAEWYPPGMLVAMLSAITAAGIVAAAMLLSDGDTELRTSVRDGLARVLEGMMPPGQADEERMAFADRIAGIFPGVAGISWMLMMAVNGSLAQGVLTGFGKNIRPSPRLALIVLPMWLYYAIGLCLLIAIVAGGSVGYIAANLAIVFAVPFFFQGLGVVHALANRVSARIMLLSIFYLVLIVSGWPALVVTVAGFMEPIAKLRLRYGRPRGPEEE